MKKLSKKLVALTLAVIMVFATCMTAFASSGNTTTLTTHLYKDGKYDAAHPDKNRSMGDGAVEDTTYVDNGDGTYTVTLHFKASFTAKPFLVTYTGYLTNVNVDVNQDGKYDANDQYTVEKTGEAVTGISFSVTSIPKINTKYDAQFTIDIADIMSRDAEGDIVILPGVTSAN